MDFFSVRSLTSKGIRELYVLAFLHVGSRRVIFSPATGHPDAAWVENAGRAFLEQARAENLKVRTVMHDRDRKFTAAFDELLKGQQVQVMRAAYRAPNTVAFVERFIQTVKQECTDYFIVFGARHLNYLLMVFGDYYHTRRPHQGLDNELLTARKLRRKKPPPDDPPPLSEVQCESQLGGLLKHYYRQAA